MKSYKGKNELSDIEKIKDYLIGLGFVCNSYSSAQNLIYSKNGERVLIKNRQEIKKNIEDDIK